MAARLDVDIHDTKTDVTSHCSMTRFVHGCEAAISRKGALWREFQVALQNPITFGAEGFDDILRVDLSEIDHRSAPRALAIGAPETNGLRLA